MPGALIGSLASSLISGGAARGAASAQERSAQAGIEEQRRQFDISQRQAEPFRATGLEALQQQRALLGLGGGAAQEAAFAGLVASPGQEFLQRRQEQALLRSRAAIGGLGGGELKTALQQQAVGFGQQDLQNQLARLSGLSGMGQTATTNIAALGAGTAGNIGNLLGAAGQAQAGGILGAGQAQAGLLGNLSQILGQQQGVAGPIDPTQTLGGRAAFALEGALL